MVDKMRFRNCHAKISVSNFPDISYNNKLYRTLQSESDEHLGRPDFPLLSVGVSADKSLSKLTTDFWQGTF